MRLKCGWAVLALVAGAGCALIPEAPPAAPDLDDVDAFVLSVRDRIELHEWQSLLASSDPVVYQERVVAGEEPEPRFLAELLGLTESGNDVQEGDTLGWEDLERIEQVALAPAGRGSPPYRITGFILLTTGEELDLETWVTRVQGRFVLTGAP